MKQHLSSGRFRGFTLVELMTVVFITAILMGIIVVPMIQSFNTVRSAQGFADAQDKGRLVLERISREISNSAGVRDNSGYNGSIDVVVPGRTGALVTVRLPWSKLDIVKPAQQGPTAGNYFVNPNTGKIDPTLHAQKGQILLPVAAGATIARYWIGLRNPFAPYANPYDGLLMQRGGGRDNLFVLYRAEVQPVINVNGVLRANTAFFEADANGKPIMDDPGFFVWDGDPNWNNPATATAKDKRILNWLSKATAITETARYDMIQPIFDKRTRLVTYDSNNAPRLVPLIQFQPTRMGSEPADPKEQVRLGVESDGMDQYAPSVFKTRLGGWVNTIVRVWPNGWTSGNPYLVARRDNTGDAKIFDYNPALGDELTTGAELFDITTYMNNAAAGNVYSFSSALNATGLSSAAARSRFVPFFVDQVLGKITASFGIYEVGAATYTGNNLPSKACGPEVGTGSSPAVDLPNGLETYTTINEQFLKVWQDHPELRPDIHRFIDLRVTPQADGTPSPLDPDPLVGFARATIVPGSEVVVGPNQLDNAPIGQLVRYARTKGKPGPNQYRINYVNLPEPTDWTLLGLTPPPANYDPTNLESAIIQPRYKAGYIQLYSEPAHPLPTGNITVSYRFQFTKVGDSLAVDYDSRQVMSLLLTIRNFPQTTDPNPQGVTLKAAATVRNFLR